MANSNNGTQNEALASAVLNDLDNAASLILRALELSGIVVIGIYETDDQVALIKTGIARENSEATLTMLDEIAESISKMETKIKEGTR